jgi:hypothetical protein
MRCTLGYVKDKVVLVTQKHLTLNQDGQEIGSFLINQTDNY